MLRFRRLIHFGCQPPRIRCLRIPGQLPTRILDAARQTCPHLPVRKKSGREHKIARPFQIGAHPPHGERSATEGDKRKNTSGERRHSAVLTRAAGHNRPSPEANLDDHKCGGCNHYNPHATMPSRSLPLQPGPRYIGCAVRSWRWTVSHIIRASIFLKKIS
jgi:hypothetical protein